MGQLLPYHCIYCSAICRKKGWYKQVQKYYCPSCHKYQRKKYSYCIASKEKDRHILLLNNEGMGISSISRYLQIAKTTVRRRILLISHTLMPPVMQETNQVYEVDEMQTFIKENKPSNYVYITYAINKVTKQVVHFVTGSRTKEMLAQVINKLLSLNPKHIYTDGLNSYPSLIPKTIHKVFRYHTNHIERNNLTIRTHIKRLCRRTICFSKSIIMLTACLKLYLYR